MTDEWQGMAINAKGWRPYMDDDEVLLWEGQPSPRLHIVWDRKNIILTLFGCLWTCLSFFALWTAVQEGEPAAYVFLAAFVGIGLFIVAGRHYWAAYRRSKTRYALTNRRAMIAFSGMQKSLKAFAIRKDSPIEIWPGDETTVVFDAETHLTSHGQPYPKRQAFELVKDGEKVAALIRKIQRR